ncbi:MAG: aldehyde ferredoxin oxidoreductase C-terminal domain-containing protein, partial [Candidatus Bathyarchaeia archaeon]
KGKAKRPSYIWVTEGSVEIRDASAFTGKDVFTVEDALKAETDKKAEVAQIGPAGEKLSCMAAVMNDKYRAAGRSGTGAVMGSKNLRAIVCAGDKKPEAADPAKFEAAWKKAREMIANHPVTKKGGLLNALGTDGVTNIINEAGVYPTKNWQFGTWDKAKNISGEALKEKYLKRNTACMFCPIACGRWSEVDKGPYATVGEGPEYETVWAFGGACGNDDLASIIRANYLCNMYGLDTISTGSTIAFAMELYDRGIITDK